MSGVVDWDAAVGAAGERPVRTGNAGELGGVRVTWEVWPWIEEYGRQALWVTVVVEAPAGQPGTERELERMTAGVRGLLTELTPRGVEVESTVLGWRSSWSGFGARIKATWTGPEAGVWEGAEAALGELGGEVRGELRRRRFMSRYVTGRMLGWSGTVRAWAAVDE